MKKVLSTLSTLLIAAIGAILLNSCMEVVEVPATEVEVNAANVTSNVQSASITRDANETEAELSPVYIEIGKHANLQAANVELLSVSLVNVYLKGEYDEVMGWGSYSNLATEANPFVLFSMAEGSSIDQAAATFSIDMIPQVLSNASLLVSYNANGTTLTESIALEDLNAGSWQSGRMNEYQIALNPEAIAFDPSVEDYKNI